MKRLSRAGYDTADRGEFPAALARPLAGHYATSDAFDPRE